jgi:hypothetical protein
MAQKHQCDVKLEKQNFCNLTETQIKMKDSMTINCRMIDLTSNCKAKANTYHFESAVFSGLLLRHHRFSSGLECPDLSPSLLHISINKKPFSGTIYCIDDINAGIRMYQITVVKGKANRNEIAVLPNPFNPKAKEALEIENMPRVTPAKPVLYLYPSQKQAVSVKLNLTTHRIIHPYPTYENGWSVIANPDGTLTNTKTNKQHYCLFWETEGAPFMQKITSGFVIKGDETADFLEQKLKILGLNDRETNEFIIYWLPQMENNAYNAIYFATNEYEKESALEISPKPDTQIRIMMMWQPLTEKTNLPEQILPPTPARKGFVAVEWGGTLMIIH